MKEIHYYKHYRTGNIYKVIDRDILLENPTTEQWTPGIVYEEFKHVDPEIGELVPVENPRKFIRSVERFNHSFEQIWKD